MHRNWTSDEDAQLVEMLRLKATAPLSQQGSTEPM
jgi:hypothetical protein